MSLASLLLPLSAVALDGHKTNFSELSRELHVDRKTLRAAVSDDVPAMNTLALRLLRRFGSPLANKHELPWFGWRNRRVLEPLLSLGDWPALADGWEMPCAAEWVSRYERLAGKLVAAAYKPFRPDLLRGVHQQILKIDSGLADSIHLRLLESAQTKSDFGRLARALALRRTLVGLRLLEMELSHMWLELGKMKSNFFDQVRATDSADGLSAAIVGYWDDFYESRSAHVRCIEVALESAGQPKQDIGSSLRRLARGGHVPTIQTWRWFPLAAQASGIDHYNDVEVAHSEKLLFIQLCLIGIRKFDLSLEAAAPEERELLGDLFGTAQQIASAGEKKMSARYCQADI